MDLDVVAELRQPCAAARHTGVHTRIGQQHGRDPAQRERNREPNINLKRLERRPPRDQNPSIMSYWNEYIIRIKTN